MDKFKTFLPEMWGKIFKDRLQQELHWGNFAIEMRPYSRGESWKSSLNRFIVDLNDNAEKRLHPERWIEKNCE